MQRGVKKQKGSRNQQFPYYARTVENPGSKPAKFNEDFIDIIERLAAKGMTQRDIADVLDVHKCTFEYWTRTKPRVREALQRGEKEAIERVKKSFYELANGYSHEDSVILTNRITEYNDEGKPVRSYIEPLIVPTIKRYPPNAFACHKILTIKDRENWTEITENNIQINIQNNIDLSDFSDTELLALEKIGLKQLAQDATVNNN